MENQDAVWYVIMVALVANVGTGLTTDIAGWLVFIAMLLMFLGALLIALISIPAVPDLVPEDILKLLVWLGVFIYLLLVFIGAIQGQLNLTIL